MAASTASTVKLFIAVVGPQVIMIACIGKLFCAASVDAPEVKLIESVLEILG